MDCPVPEVAFTRQSTPVLRRVDRLNRTNEYVLLQHWLSQSSYPTKTTSSSEDSSQEQRSVKLRKKTSALPYQAIFALCLTWLYCFAY
ncbi:hypothetical protein KCU88_g13, partial [Aureobasidium melanogenum]